jgi:hypothetical protein
MSTVRTGAVLLLVALALTGCAQQGFSVLDTEQTEKDELPTTFDGIDLSGYDTSSSRFAGSYEGSDFYLVVPEGKLSPCLAITGDNGTMIACGGDGGGGTLEAEVSDGVRVQLMTEPAVEGDGWTVVSDNIRVKK